jgi:hypothetical protein
MPASFVDASLPEKSPVGVVSGDRGFLNRCLWDLQLSVQYAELPGRRIPLVNVTKAAISCAQPDGNHLP